ncbi:MAG: hypothetical protein ACKV19_21525 [Verrucomicrobiales bacterium]
MNTKQHPNIPPTTPAAASSLSCEYPVPDLHRWGSGHTSTTPTSRPLRRFQIGAGRRWLLSALMGLLAAVGVIPAHAAPRETIRHDRRPYFPTYPKTGNRWTSHRGAVDGLNGGGWQTFSVVTFPADEIVTRIRWTGHYEDFVNESNNPASPNVHTWKFSIHEDLSGAPGDALFTMTKPAAEVRTTSLGLVRSLRNTHYTVPVYEFEVVLSEPFHASKNTRYWFSPESIGDTFNPFWAWVEGVRDRGETLAGGSFIRLDQGFNTWQKATGDNPDPDPGQRQFDRAMTLIGRPANDGDADGLEDGWEQAHGLDPFTDDSAADPDLDRADNLAEFERRSDPRRPDTDGDGLLDGVESNTGVWVGLNDTGSSPVLADTDRDRLPDGREVPGAVPGPGSNVSPSNPNRHDSDLDGYNDFVEFENGFNPVDAASAPAPILLGTGGAALLGGDLTDPEDDGNPDDNTGYNAVFNANNMPSFTNSGAFNVFDGRLGTAADQWTPTTDQSKPYLVWAEFTTPIILDHFTIASSSDFYYAEEMIWEIQGSNDGITWETIFMRINVSQGFASLWTARSQVFRFNAGLHYPRPPAYRMIRFDARQLLPTNRVRLGELEFFGYADGFEIAKLEVLDTTRVRVEWDSIAGAFYDLEVSEDLVRWEKAALRLPGSGTLTSHIHEVPAGLPPNATYRVRQVE